MKRKAWVCVLMAVMGMVCAMRAYGWHTFFRNTHRWITRDAVAGLMWDEYPDMKMRLKDLEDGSDTEPHNVPGDNKDFDIWMPPADQWWEGKNKSDKESSTYNMKGAKLYYLEYEFADAYKVIGFMLHLKQDEKVPAHMYKCVHGFTPFELVFHSDDLEDYAIWHFGYGAPVPEKEWKFTDKKGFTWYYWLNDEMDDDDENDIPDGPGGGGAIIDGPGGTVEPVEGNWGVGSNNFGTYGYGDYSLGFDPLPGRNEGIDYFQQKPNWRIMYGQLFLAMEASVEVLETYSKELPPLIPDGNKGYGRVAVGPGIFGPRYPLWIRFRVLENRKPKVRVRVECGGEAVKAGGKVWDGGEGATFELDKWTGGELPYAKWWRKEWGGELKEGRLEDGIYELKMQVTDEDGKKSEERWRVVGYDETPPEVVEVKLKVVP